MNDLDVLDRFGPAPTTLTEETLALARLRLEARMSGRAPSAGGRPVRRVAVALTAAAAVAACVAVSSPFGSSPAIALVAADSLTFPVTPTYLPAGLPLKRFTFNAQAQDAMYGEDPSCDSRSTSCTADRVTVSIRDSYRSWKGLSNASAVDVTGRPGWGFGAPWTAEHPEYTVVWKDTDGDIVGVTGEGAYASPAVVEQVADSVVDTSQPVDLFLTVTPEDWSLHTYLSDQYVTYGRIGELSVTLLDRSVLDLGLTGAEGVRSVTVDGRPAQIGQVNDERGNRWVLQSTAPDGQGFHLETPTSLTSDQVIAIAAGVRHR